MIYNGKMRSHYFLVIDDREQAPAQWSGFLVKLVGGSRSQAHQDKVRGLIESLWMDGQLPQHCFVNGFSEDNIIMARPKKEVDRELLPIEQAGNYLIELIELVAAKAEAQQEYSPLATMVEKIFTGREQELTSEEIQQAQDSKTVKTVISKLTRSIAEVELCRKNCEEHQDLIQGIIEMGQNDSYQIQSTQELIEDAEVSQNGEKTGKTVPKKSV